MIEENIMYGCSPRCGKSVNMEIRKLCDKYKNFIDEERKEFTNFFNQNIYPIIRKQINREFMKLISETRKDPMFCNYYDAKNLVLSTITYDIVGFTAIFRPKTIEEIERDGIIEVSMSKKEIDYTIDLTPVINYRWNHYDYYCISIY